MNIVSLRKHKHELEVILRENDIDIIGLRETRLNEQIDDSEVNITGFFRNDRDENGGGSNFICKRESAIPNRKIEREKLELLSIETSPTQAKSFLIVCRYRPPTSGVDEESFENLRKSLKQLDKEGKEIILIGV